MKVNFKSRLIALISFLFIVIFSCFFISGCQSTDESNSYFDSSSISQSKFTYNEETDKTRIEWTGTFRNDTIYDIENLAIKFDMYANGSLINTETVNYTVYISHGSAYSGNFNFITDGQISAIEYNSWHAEYSSFWETYSIWLIVVAAIAVVGTIAYIIFMIVNDQDLSDTFDDAVEFVADNLVILVVLLIPIGGSIWGILTQNWVPVLIVLSGIVAFVLLALLAHLIRYIVISISDGIVFGGSSYSNQTFKDKDEFDNETESVSDYLDDKDKLTLFTAVQLKEYCRDNGLKGYSSLNKPQLVDFVYESGHEEADTQKTEQKPALGKKTVNGITFDDIAGLEEAKRAFKEKVVLPLEHRELYEKYGKKVGGGILLYGLPGTGKTLFAEAASHETNALFIPIKCSDIKSKWYGESEANVKNIFNKARKAKKAIIFFDEFEAIGAKRTDSSDNGNNDLVPQILAEMQGVGTSKNDSMIVVIAATNKPWMIDSAFLRPGRFDEKIYIPLPDSEARKKMFELKLKGIPQADLDYSYLAEISDGFNGADIGAFCEKLKMLAIQKNIETNIESPISMTEVEQVREVIKSSVSTEDIDRLSEFEKQYT